MEKPDFAKYSETQLRQILTRIDAERFPDRVEEIHARLAQLEAERATRTDVEEPKQHDGPPGIAGFWRRSAAFALDWVLLGLVGLLLGLFLQEQFEAMGAWGRALGFVVALAYFGTMESRMFQGRTFGKLALGIKVVSADGAPPGFGKALLRSTVFCVPYFLNHADLGAGYANVVLPAIQSLLVFGLGGAIVYLYLFNRRTRQSVHDLLTGAVVVRAGTGVPPLVPVWRGHLAVIAALFVLTFGGVAYFYSMIGHGVLQPLMLVQQQVSRMPGVRNAGVFQGTGCSSGDKRTNFLSIKAVTSTRSVDDLDLARKIAETTLTTYPPAQQLDAFSVTLMHGYDIGIASYWNSRTFNGSPEDWRQGRVGHD